MSENKKRKISRIDYIKEHLEFGEVICSLCNGHGQGTEQTIEFCEICRIEHPSICKKCEGRGKVDWVKNVVK